jgi:NAD(P)-dependent dehydrogenase (short-subunit alcohol dehydrogenase family)
VAATLVLDLGRIPDGEGDQGVLASFQALQRHAASLSGGAVVGVLSIDGAFGLGARPPASDLVSLGLSGVVKTAAAEWGVRALVLDIDPALGTAAAAAVVTEEMGRSGPRERGRLADGTRLGVGLRDAPLRPRGPLPLHDGDLVVVSGGARGVTAEAVRALAREVKANFLLLGRMPEPDAEPTWLLEAHDEAAVKRALIQHRFQGQAPGPRVLGQEAERVLAARDLRRNLAELRATGAQVRYAAVDVQDAPAVDAVVGQMRAEAGPVRAVVHGAGVLRDRRIEDKTAEDWGAVWGPKVRGLSALLGALREDEPRAILAFTSVTGRVGRRGQVDYAAANEAVTGLLRLESRRRPGCRVASLDWGPWAGGMVTSGLRKQFEREGVEPIPLDAGARHFVDELAASTSAPGEVLIGEVGDIRGHRPAPGAQPWTPHRPGLRRRLDPAVDRWLDDHRLAGKPVLPMAVALEWLAEAACAEVEGAVFRGAEDVAVLQGIVLDGPVDLDIGVHEEANGVGERRFVGEIRGPGGRIHVRATLLLGSTRPTAPRVPINPAEPAPSREPCPAYGEELFHGPSFRVLRGIPDLPGTGFTASADAAGVAPTMGLPECAAVTAPLVLDAVFQAAILWCRNHRGGPSLPARVRRWEQYAPPEAFQNVRVDATLVGGTATSPQFDAEVVSGEGALLARLQGFRCTVSPRLDSAFQAREAAGEGPSPQA